LLGETLIVPDLNTATVALRETDGAYDFVTLQGEMLSRHGVYTGGYANGAGKTPGSILGRRNQISDLQAAVAKAQERMDEFSRRKGALTGERRRPS
jgi:chromosome segregation ATPase